ALAGEKKLGRERQNTTVAIFDVGGMCGWVLRSDCLVQIQGQGGCFNLDRKRIVGLVKVASPYAGPDILYIFLILASFDLRVGMQAGSVFGGEWLPHCYIFHLLEHQRGKAWASAAGRA